MEHARLPHRTQRQKCNSFICIGLRKFPGRRVQSHAQFPIGLVGTDDFSRVWTDGSLRERHDGSYRHKAGRLHDGRPSGFVSVRQATRDQLRHHHESRRADATLPQEPPPQPDRLPVPIRQDRLPNRQSAQRRNPAAPQLFPIARSIQPHSHGQERPHHPVTEDSRCSRGRSQRTRFPRQRRVARRTRLCDAARGRRDDGDRRDDAGSDPPAGSAGSRRPRAYRVMRARPAHDRDCRGSARVSADRHRDDHLHGHRRALRGSSDFGSTHSTRAGHLHGSRSCPLSSTVPPTFASSPWRTTSGKAVTACHDVYRDRCTGPSTPRCSPPGE